MTTNELIRELRENVAWGYAGDLMLKAADRLEDLDERVAIKEADEPHENEQSKGEQLTF